MADWRLIVTAELPKERPRPAKATLPEQLPDHNVERTEHAGGNGVGSIRSSRLDDPSHRSTGSRPAIGAFCLYEVGRVQQGLETM